MPPGGWWRRSGLRLSLLLLSHAGTTIDPLGREGHRSAPRSRRSGPCAQQAPARPPPPARCPARSRSTSRGAAAPEGLRSPPRRSARKRPSRSGRRPRPPADPRGGSARAERQTSSASRSTRIASRSTAEPMPASSSQCRGRGVVNAEALEQRAVGHDVRVAPDRRGEVAVAGAAQPGVTEVPRAVEGLLERAQDQRAERVAVGHQARPPRRQPPAARSCSPGRAACGRRARRAARS